MTSDTTVRVISGSIALSAGKFMYSAVSAVGSIVIARLLSPADYGLLSVALIYPLMLGGLSDLGLSTAVMRYASLAPYHAISLNRPYIIPLIYILAIYTFSSNVVSNRQRATGI